MPLKMHSNTRSKSVSFSLKTLSAAVVTALLFANANAAGLGKLTVLSSLGQPLHAEIELTSVGKDEAGTLAPKLASTEAFRQANIEFNPALFSLRFAVEQRAGRQFIRVTSAQPINEPFVDMLLELGGSGNKLVREYTFLLDPADLRSSQSPQVAPPVVLPPAPLARRAQTAEPAAEPSTPVPAAASNAVTPKSTESAVPAERSVKRPVERPAQSAPIAPPAATQPSTGVSGKAPASEYQVKQGDSLSRIAGQVKPENVSLDQMLVALYRANPDAFLGKNMNRLRAGQILSVPDANTVTSVSTADARNIVVTQSSDFNGYRNKLASQVATASPAKSAESRQSATGKITAKVEEPVTAANESKDKLKLSKSGVAGPDKSSTIAAGAEDRIAKEKALAEANARVKELEKNLNDLTKLLEIKNKNLEEQQRLAEAAKASAAKQAPAVAVAPVASKPAEVKSASKPAEVKPASAPTAVASAPVVVTPPAASTPSASAPVASASVPAVSAPPASVPPTSSAAASASTSAPAASVPPVAPAVKPKPKVVVAPAPVPQSSFLDDLLDNPMFLGAGVLLAVLGGFGIYSVNARRKKQKKNFEDSIITDSSLKANSLFGSTGGQSVDTNNSVFNSNFTPSSHQLDTNEVDPVAEADVYIAYGRDAQAEEILKEALRTQPERHAVRVKLLEIYSNRKDLRAFETLASELYGLTKGEGDDWLQAATLGIGLDPNNPLYAAGKTGENTLGRASMMVAPTQALDEPDLDALLAVTQSDTDAEPLSDVENSAYFVNTSMATKVVPREPVPDPDFTAPVIPDEVHPVEPVAQPAAPIAGNELDFDLDGLDLTPPSEPIVKPAPVEPEHDFGSINFDFLQEASAPKTIQPAVSPAPAVEINAAAPAIPADDFASLDIDFPMMPDLPLQSTAPAPQAAAQPEPTPQAMDFDLSDITLELHPNDVQQHAAAQPDLDTAVMDTHEYSNSAEMATKLDLAVAYQEIGDKEGARELLDEVVRGGTPEQAEEARAILVKLG